MSANLARETFPDEKPTTPRAHVPTWTLALATRVAKLCDLATEQLANGSAPAIAAAVVTVAQAKALCLEVLR